ncbi:MULTISPECIES: hypothetical protein [Nostocales]|uniref:hypothetical protein n=1 Tax=Nostocales TaxID=1161 RepID=UPI001F2231B9|nr:MULTISPECIES: hypothetical protein [Nostocales]
MTQKQQQEKNTQLEILQTIDPKGIADKSMRRTIEILLNLIEQLQLEVKELREENQHLRDENNRLKGEQGKPEIKQSLSSQLALRGEHDPRQAKYMDRINYILFIYQSFVS